MPVYFEQHDCSFACLEEEMASRFVEAEGSFAERLEGMVLALQSGAPR
jgi:hypothetical protein